MPPAVHRLDASPATVHWGFFDAALAPVAHVRSGDVVRIRTVSGSPDYPIPAEWMPPELPLIFAEVRDRGPGPHILTGPIFVDGARAGQVLQVDILSIRLGASYGYNVVRPLAGLFPEEVEELDVCTIPLDRETGLATVPPGVALQTRPFFGILGVAPPRRWGRISSAAPRAHGGNMDNKELVAGTTLFLPVWVDGALLSVGDGHAAQGDGEVCVTAIETCLDGELRLTVRGDFTLSLPLGLTPTHLVTMGFHEDLDSAAQAAVRALLDLLQAHCQLTWRDAYRLASLAADLRVTQVVNGVKGVHVMVERALLARLGCRVPFATGA